MTGSVPEQVPRITCPAITCRAENDAVAEVCAECLTPLAAYGRLSMHADALFNQGLRSARAGDSSAARDLFSAVVHWQPHDLDARNAHALACLDAGDAGDARSGWEAVLERWPGDETATRGLAWLKASAEARQAKKPPGKPKSRLGTKHKPKSKRPTPAKRKGG